MNRTSHSQCGASATCERELTIRELEAVSGGLMNTEPRASGGYTLPVNYEAMTVWNTLLGQYGYSHGSIWPPY